MTTKYTPISERDFSHFRLMPCPCCGFEPEAADGDCIYPVTRPDADGKVVWNINCYESGGGCSLNILGSSPEECVDKWNRRSNTLEPVEGDVLPPIGSRVRIHLASIDSWVEHTVVGYYVWPGHKDPEKYRIAVRVRSDDGYFNARSLEDVQRI